MNCPVQSPGNSNLLLDYCARRLPPEVAGVLERHMDNCPACAGFRLGQQTLWKALDEWDAAPVDEDFDRKLYRRLETRSGSEGRPSRWFRMLRSRPALPIAAAASLVLAGVLLQAPESPRGPAPGKQTLEVEQVEHALDAVEMLENFEPLGK